MELLPEIKMVCMVRLDPESAGVCQAWGPLGWTWCLGLRCWPCSGASWEPWSLGDFLDLVAHFILLWAVGQTVGVMEHTLPLQTSNYLLLSNAGWFCPEGYINESCLQGTHSLWEGTEIKHNQLYHKACCVKCHQRALDNKELEGPSYDLQIMEEVVELE